MHATGGDATKPIVPSFVVQEEGSRKVLVYLEIPELKVKRSFPNLLKFVPTNGIVKELDFRDRSFTFTITVQKAIYSMSIPRLPGEIQPDRCSITYQRNGCWITLVKADTTPWMNRICDNLNPGLNFEETPDTFSTPEPSAPVAEISLKESDMPPPFNMVPCAPPVPSRASAKKTPAPQPPSSAN